MQVIKYNDSYKNQWDDFVRQSKNGTFLFLRDYMEYHKSRFEDMSLIILDKKDRIIALLPANMKSGQLITHEGLTYGGFVYNHHMTQPAMIDLFAAIIEHLHHLQIKLFYYKTIPMIYHKGPSHEDLYPLFLLNAPLARRDTLTVIDNLYPVQFQNRRLRMIKKASTKSFSLQRHSCYRPFWKILEENLKKRHHTTPVHSIEEMQKLADTFPDHIKLFCVSLDNEIVSGAVIYETDTVAHFQYIAANETGKTSGALDWMIASLIQDTYSQKRYIDLGISNELAGRKINQGLIDFKEGFGGRTITHDFYQIHIGENTSSHLMVAE